MARRKKAVRDRGATWQPKVYPDARKGRWCVDCGSKFSPRRKFFEAEGDAQTYANAKREEWLDLLAQRKVEQTDNVVVRLTGYTDTQRRDIAAVMGRFGDDTQKLINAVDYFFLHNPQEGVKHLVKDVAEKYLLNQKSANKHKTWLDCTSKLKPFIAKFGEMDVAGLTTTEIKTWLEGQQYTPATFNAYKTALNGFFVYAVYEMATTHNPIDGIRKIKYQTGSPAIHTVAEIQELLNKAKAHPHADKIVPYIAIGYFAGLRPENELVKLTWSHIDFNTKKIHVDFKNAKDASNRFVEMSENLVNWLKPYAKDSDDKIGNHRRIFDVVKKAAGIKWTKDVMRHSFGSYHFANCEDAGKTSYQMGHMTSKMLFKHYRFLVKKTEAEAFWNINP